MLSRPVSSSIPQTRQGREFANRLLSYVQYPLEPKKDSTTVDSKSMPASTTTVVTPPRKPDESTKKRKRTLSPPPTDHGRADKKKKDPYGNVVVTLAQSQLGSADTSDTNVCTLGARVYVRNMKQELARLNYSSNGPMSEKRKLKIERLTERMKRVQEDPQQLLNKSILLLKQIPDPDGRIMVRTSVADLNNGDGSHLAAMKGTNNNVHRGVKNKQRFVDIPLRSLKPRTEMKANSSVLVVGPRNSGKTVVLCQMMREHKIAKFVVFCGTAFHAKSPYKDACNHDAIFTEYNNDVLESLLDAQQAIIDKLGLSFERMTKSEIDHYMKKIGLCVVFDDVTNEGTKIWNSTGFSKLMYNGKHLGCFVLASVHYATAINFSSRGQFEYVLAMIDAKKTNHDKLHEYFFGCVPRKDTLTDVFMMVTSHRAALVCKTTKNTFFIDDNLAYYEGRYPLLEGQAPLGKTSYRKARLVRQTDPD